MVQLFMERSAQQFSAEAESSSTFVTLRQQIKSCETPKISCGAQRCTAC